MEYVKNKKYVFSIAIDRLYRNFVTDSEFLDMTFRCEEYKKDKYGLLFGVAETGLCTWLFILKIDSWVEIK